MPLCTYGLNAVDEWAGERQEVKEMRSEGRVTAGARLGEGTEGGGAQQRPAQQPPAEQRPAEQRPAQQRPAEQRAGNAHRGSVRIARIGGIDILVHWSFLVLPLLVALGATGAASVGWEMVWIGAIFASVVVHELAHSLVAKRKGVVVRDILLLPIGGMSQIEEMPEDPRDELAIAIVGPLASIAIALFLFAVGLVFHIPLWPPTLFARSWVARLGWMNLLLGAFNLLPALPMDGGRVLRAALARRRGRREGTAIAVSIARGVAILMIVGGLFYNLWLVVIGIFVLVGASAEGSTTQTRRNGPGPPPSQASLSLGPPPSSEHSRGNARTD